MKRFQVVAFSFLILISIIFLTYNAYEMWYEVTNVPTWFEYSPGTGTMYAAKGAAGGTGPIYFPGQSTNRTIEIYLIASVGTFDCIVLVSHQYHRLREGKAYHALFEDLNSTEVNTTVFVPLEARGSHTAYVLYQNPYSNLTLYRIIVARCLAPYWNAKNCQSDWTPIE